jgi:hypothetical protein
MSADGENWSASCSGLFISRNIVSGTDWVGSWMGPRADMDAVAYWGRIYTRMYFYLCLYLHILLQRLYIWMSISEESQNFKGFDISKRLLIRIESMKPCTWPSVPRKEPQFFSSDLHLHACWLECRVCHWWESHAPCPAVSPHCSSSTSDCTHTSGLHQAKAKSGCWSRSLYNTAFW